MNHSRHAPTHLMRDRLKAARVSMLVPRGVSHTLDLVAIFIVARVVSSVSPPGISATTWLWLALTAIVLYFVICEKLWQGTLGKHCVGLRVVNAQGTSISWGQSVTRNVIRLFEGGLGALALPGALFIAFSKDQQRFGDMAAQTWVVPRHLLGARAEPAPAAEERTPS